MMTIAEGIIMSAVLRYHREYDRYIKLSARAACRFQELSKLENVGIS